MFRCRLALLVAAALAVLICSAGLSAADPSAPSIPSAPGEPPPADTIVEVTGDAANGFHITHYDGSALFPPTDSEARAECSEYDTRVARVRCRAEVLTWYADLADLQQALDYAHAVGG